MALSWYKMAAACGDAESMRDLGNFFELGSFGILKDVREAEKWYREAAKRGHEGAKRRLFELLNLNR